VFGKAKRKVTDNKKGDLIEVILQAGPCKTDGRAATQARSRSKGPGLSR